MSKTQKGLLAFILVILLCLVFMMRLDYQRTGEAIILQNGTYHIESWDGMPKALEGEWQVWPNKLYSDLEFDKMGQADYVDVPHLWDEEPLMQESPYGYATYHCTLSGLKPLHPYGFYIRDEATAYQLYVNGVLSASNGNVLDNTPEWRPVTGSFLTDEKGNADFYMAIANTSYIRGGFWNPIEIGDISAVIDAQNRLLVSDMFFIASIFIMGIFFLGVFSAHPPKITTLYFSLFCLTMSARLGLVGQRLIQSIVPGLPWSLLIKLEYITGYLMLPLFGLFLINIVRLKYQSHITIGFYAIMAFGIGMPLVSSVQDYGAFLMGYKYLALFVCLIGLIVLVQMLNKGYTGIYYYIIAMSAIILSVIKEIFFQDNLSYLPFGAFIMIVAFSLMTIEEFVSIAKQNQILSSEIALDKLTSVKNRNFLETYLNQLVERDYVNDCYLLFLDLDRFKPINDVYGHAVGDDVLRMVAKRLQGILRSNDLLGRYGGDEFVIIIDNQSMKDVQKIVNRMITTINTAMLIDERHYYVGVSVGICKYERDWTASQWLAYGDMAMYRAKKSGGNRYVIFEDHMKTEVLESTSDI